MRKTLQWIHDRFSNPEIIITENGISDRAGNIDDMARVYYYKHNINSMLKGKIILLYTFFKNVINIPQVEF